MSAFNSKIEYGSVAKFFHWLIALAIIGLLCVGFVMTNLNDNETKWQVYGIHKMIGLFTLLFVLGRVVWTLINIKPSLPEQMSGLERLLERVGHYLLYLGMLAMPISGWMMSTASDHIPVVFGSKVPMPFVGLNKPLAGVAHTVHELAGYLLAAMVILHIMAALKHHFKNKDDVLKRMMPGKRII